jgi:hypothetical protein
MKWLTRIRCWLFGHIPGHYAYILLGATPKGEPSLNQFAKWIGRPSEVIGTSLTNSELRCQRCGEKLE